MSSPSLELVTLDAGGTLLRERVSRGAMYAEIAREENLTISDEAMEALMRTVHDRLPQELDGAWRYEHAWFQALIEELFVGELGLAPERLTGVQRALFTRYRDASLFEVLPGAIELQADLARSGVRMAVLSNWSPDLHLLLDGLGLSGPLEFALTSAEERCEKPQAQIFERALERAGVSPENALHVGNDPRKDHDAALAVGMDALLIGPAQNDGRRRVPERFAVSTTLAERLP